MSMDAANNQGIHIRQAVEADLPFLRGESEAPYLKFLFHTAFQGMKRDEQIMWVVEKEGQGVVGHVFVQFKSIRNTLADGVERAYFYSFHVYQEYRGFGVGTQLLKHLEADLLRRGFQIVTLTVAKENERARELYQRNGYLVTGTEVINVRSNQVHGEWKRDEELAWRMEKRLF